MIQKNFCRFIHSGFAQLIHTACFCEERCYLLGNALNEIMARHGLLDCANNWAQITHKS